ncbi:MAG: prephenate dehydratase [Ignavibacteriae bacterium]|nr:prephenate dehydratase [Ignavibacteriota bacterium]
MPIIAYQGEPGAFSEKAAHALFGKRTTTKPKPSFKEVFRFASGSGSHYGVIPIENSLFGSVHENYDLLLRHKLHIVGEVKLRIQLHLMALPGVSIRNVKAVYSHPQALGQCEPFLRRMNGVEVVAYYDTAGSAKMIREQKRSDAAAIASAQAAQVYGLRTLRRNVESNHHNYTRFLVLSKSRAQLAPNMKTSVVFAVRNIPGALFKALGSFALREINLLKIESRPLVGKPWQYLFYLDIEGSVRDPHIVAALKHLQELSTLVRVLGSYPVGKTIQT